MPVAEVEHEARGGEIDDRPVGAQGRGPITKDVQDTFFAATRGEVPEYDRWLDPVD